MADLMAQCGEQHGLQLDSRELPIICRRIREYLRNSPKSEAPYIIAPILALLSARFGTA
ncbi:hypothetical protein KCP73_00080 [Salmonella enterica subsp. enterica]|nr:hypothetical protein KCP73_00080 [Salmonella enterica subsp. enterica]